MLNLGIGISIGDTEGDAQVGPGPVINGVLKTESGAFLTTESGQFLAFD